MCVLVLPNLFQKAKSLFVFSRASARISSIVALRSLAIAAAMKGMWLGSDMAPLKTYEGGGGVERRGKEREGEEQRRERGGGREEQGCDESERVWVGGSGPRKETYRERNGEKKSREGRV